MIELLFQELSPLADWPTIEKRPFTSSSTKQLRILMVTPRYYPQRGPLENHVYQVVHRLAKAGHDLTVLTSSVSRHFASEEKVDGITIRRVSADLEKETFDAALDLYTTIRYGEWDIVHLQSSHTMLGLLAMYAAAQAQIPYVVTLHGGDYVSDSNNHLYDLQQRLLRPLLLRAVQLIAPTQFAMDYYSERLNLPVEKFSVIPNGNDFIPRGKNYGNDQSVLITAVGNIESPFGQHRMIAAMPHILDHYPYARLRILGQTLNRAILERQALVLGVADHVEIPTFAEERDTALGTPTEGNTLVTAWSSDHPYVAALSANLGPKPAILISKCNSPTQDLIPADQFCIIDTASTPQELASAIVEQLRSALTETISHLPTWDDCVNSLLPLYHTFSGSFWEFRVSQHVQFN